MINVMARTSSQEPLFRPLLVNTRPGRLVADKVVGHTNVTVGIVYGAPTVAVARFVAKAHT